MLFNVAANKASFPLEMLKMHIVTFLRTRGRPCVREMAIELAMLPVPIMVTCGELLCALAHAEQIAARRCTALRTTMRTCLYKPADESSRLLDFHQLPCVPVLLYS